MVHDGQLYEHYLYPSYYNQPSASKHPINPQDKVTDAVAGPVPVPLETVKVNNNVANAGVNSVSVPRPHRTNCQGSISLDNSAFSDGKSKHVPVPPGNNFYGRSQNLHPSSCLVQSRPNSGMNQAGFDRMYPNNSIYGQYRNMFRPGSENRTPSYGHGVSRHGGMGADNGCNMPRARVDDSFTPDRLLIGPKELNRGPRSKGCMKLKDLESAAIVMEGQQIQQSAGLNNEKKQSELDLGQYNKEDFPEVYKDARFFIIKSYSEHDVHNSIKYGAWVSTANGNKKLDAAYREAQEVPGGCPVFLFFSVNASGQFVGVTEMTSAVDFDKPVEYWQQDRWTGQFSVKWHIVKDVPNALLRHIILANNEDKPVTHSRDTQEVKLEQGNEMLKIFKDHLSLTSILDDFNFFEAHQKIIQERKAAKRQEFNEMDGSDESSEDSIDCNDSKSLDVASPGLVDCNDSKPLDVASPGLVEDPLVVENMAAASDADHHPSRPE